MKRLSNRKAFWEPILIGLTILTVSVLFTLGVFFFFTTQAKGEEVPFCKMWNTMGDDPTGDEPVTSPQRQMFHLGYYLTKSDFVRTMLNADQPPSIANGLLVDEIVTCYEEHTPILVDEVNDLCQCSQEDRKEQEQVLFSAYINECEKEVKLSFGK
jgi:hypothetical protein